MSQPSTQNPAAPAATAAEAAEQAKASRREAGALLRAARESAGRGVAELATQLKVSPEKIGALESGDWSGLHDDAYARGLLRAAAKALRADVEAVLRPLPPAFVRGTPIVPPSAVDLGPARAATAVGVQGGTRRLVRVALLLVALALLLLYLPRSARLGIWMEDLAQRVGLHGAVVSRTAVTPAPQSASAAGQVGAVPASQAAPAASQVPAPVQAAVQAAVPVASQGGVAAAAPQSAQPAAASAPLGPAGPMLALSASGQSWVQVRSQSGKVLFAGLLAAGTTQNVATLASDFPLRVVVGNAGQTRVQLGGRAVALNAGGANVARLVLQASGT